MPIDRRPSDLVFDQLLTPFKGRKKLSRGYGGWAIFLWKEEGQILAIVQQQQQQAAIMTVIERLLSKKS